MTTSNEIISINLEIDNEDSLLINEIISALSNKGSVREQIIKYPILTKIRQKLEYHKAYKDQ